MSAYISKHLTQEEFLAEVQKVYENAPRAATIDVELFCRQMASCLYELQNETEERVMREVIEELKQGFARTVHLPCLN